MPCLLRQFGAEFHHLLRIVDRDDLLRALRHQLRDRALARAQVGDHHAAASVSAAPRRFPSRTVQARTAGRTCRPVRRNSGACCPGACARPGGAPRCPARPREPRPAAWRSSPSVRRARSGGRKLFFPIRRSSTRPACFNCARCVEIWLCPLDKNLLQFRHGELLLFEQQAARAAGWDRPPAAAISGLTPCCENS